MLEERALNPHDTVVLTGMDDGQSFLKIGVLFLEKSRQDTDTARAQYSDVRF